MIVLIQYINLLNVSWIIKSLIFEEYGAFKYGIILYTNIFAEKMYFYSHFYSKNTCEFDIVLTRTVNILPTNELIKYTEQLGPGYNICRYILTA